MFSPLPLRALTRAATAAGGQPEEVLRSRLRERFSVEDALLCGSGTQALQLALRAACSRAPGGRDLVSLPAYTCYDVASAAIGAGVRVVFYDVDPESLTPDIGSLVRTLELGPAAVVVAPLFGYQPDWDALRALVSTHDVLLVEDAAQSFGARWAGRTVGGLGDLSVLSFGRGKGWTAVEGGALLGAARELAPLRATLLPPLGGTAARTVLKGLLQWSFGRPSLYAVPSAVPGVRLGETVFHPPVSPRALGAAAARLALETARAAESEAEARRERGRALADRLRAEARTGLRVPRPDPRSEAGNLRLPVLVSPRARARLLARGRALGIMSMYPRTLPDLPSLGANIRGPRGDYPGADALARSLLTVPTHSLVTPMDSSRILALFRDADV